MNRLQQHLWAFAALAALSQYVAADTLVVSNRGDETVSIFDTQTHELVTRAKIEVGAHEFAVAPDGFTVVGSCYGSGPQHRDPDQRLVVFDLRKPQEARMIDLKDNPRPNDLRFVDEKRVAVTSEVRQRVLVVDVESGSIEQSLDHKHPAGHMLAAAPDGSRAYVSCVAPGAVVAVNLKGVPAVAWTTTTALGAEGIDITPDGRFIWAACNRAGKIAVLRAEDGQLVEEFAADGFPFRVRITPDGSYVVASHPNTHELRIYDAETFAVIEKVKLDGGLPTSIALSSDGSHAYVVCSAQQKIAEVDLNSFAVTHWYETGPVPDAIAVGAALPARTAPAEESAEEE